MAVVALVVPLATACKGGEALEPNTAVQRQLQDVLDHAVSNPDVVLPGAIAHYRSPAFASWTGTAGLGDVDAGVAMRPHDKYRGGSLTKPLLATVVLQHVEEGTLTLEQTLPELLPQTVTDRIPNADRITLRMLLSHTSGIAEWSTPQMDLRAVTEPLRVWEPDEFIDAASHLPPTFEPGTSWSYSNTNYTLVGMVLDRAIGQPWRAQIRERVIEPLGLDSTSLPEPGDPSIDGHYARGYHPVDGAVVDLTLMDPSMADAAGGHALITRAEDLGRFLDSLLAGELFTHDATLTEMLTMVQTPADGGPTHFYGLGIESYIIDGVEVIGHGGGAGGYNNGIFHVPDDGATIVLNVNTGDSDANIHEVILPALQIVAADAK